MTKGQIKAIADFLHQTCEGNAIYGEVILINELQPFGVSYKRKSKMLYADNGRKVKAPVYTLAQLNKELGGVVTGNASDHGISGVGLALTLCKLLDLKVNIKAGRGTQFRLCVEALYEAAGKEVVHGS